MEELNGVRYEHDVAGEPIYQRLLKAYPGGVGSESSESPAAVQPTMRTNSCDLGHLDVE